MFWGKSNLTSPTGKSFPGGARAKKIHMPIQETQETWVWSLGRENPLKKEMATHSSILAWEIPWTEQPSVLESMGLQRVRYDWMIEQQEETGFIFCM